MTAKNHLGFLPLARPAATGTTPSREIVALDDGYRTPVYVYRSDGSKLPVVMLHGIQSHPGWFTQSAESLAGAGHVLFQPTRRGSGENVQDRGHAHSGRQLLDDVAAACRFALENTGAPRLHLIGISWGGKLAAAYAAQPKAGGELASLTLVAPGIVPRVDVDLTVKLRIAAAAVVNRRRLFDIPLSDETLFTRNEQMLRFLRWDKCRLHKATAGFLLASRKLDWLLAFSGRKAIRVPLHLVCASDDLIIDNVATVRKVMRMAGGGFSLTQLDGQHTLEFEQDPSRLYEVLAEFLAAAEA